MRRRPLNVPPDTLIWIYSTLLSGRFAASARLAKMHVGTPEGLMHLAKEACIISEKEFCEYYMGATQACAIKLSEVKPIPPGADLKLIRNKIDKSFHPPQFFQKTFVKSPLTSFLRQLIQEAA